MVYIEADPVVFVLVADTQGRCVTLVRDSITAVILYYFSR